VTGAAVLTLIFHSIEGGGADASGFLGAFRAVFHLAGIAVTASVLVIPWWLRAAKPGQQN
jgi:hypothetical protein